MTNEQLTAISPMQIRPRRFTDGRTVFRTALPGRRNGCVPQRGVRHSAVVRAVLRNRNAAAPAGGLAACTTPSVVTPERRRYPRRTGRCLVAVLPALPETAAVANREWAFRAALIRGLIHDLSIGGVAFAVTEPIEPGRLLDVELRHPHRHAAVVRRVSVVAQQQQDDVRWMIRCRFLQPLTFDEVSQLSVEPTV